MSPTLHRRVFPVAVAVVAAVAVVVVCLPGLGWTMRSCSPCSAMVTTTTTTIIPITTIPKPIIIIIIIIIICPLYHFNYCHNP